ncbi:hypothetical protein PCA10_08480 [Metapseudomonas resinovorans NBRC 106553]|uniref:Uncharacterized protein n=1 Tax=Metapseudomonas resinovorans NBRC 106553 TaxID=1245471 RepID=S6AFJ7_METRE|nr:hypothetical protein PCA10_08480 [Pseudomonas resinovorans NBRC 106553]
MVDVADLLQPLAEAEQTRTASGQGKQMSDTGGPVFEILVAHVGIA